MCRNWGSHGSEYKDGCLQVSSTTTQKAAILKYGVDQAVLNVFDICQIVPEM
jgi:hypothetical protein